MSQKQKGFRQVCHGIVTVLLYTRDLGRFYSAYPVVPKPLKIQPEGRAVPASPRTALLADELHMSKSDLTSLISQATCFFEGMEPARTAAGA